jgi:hypothetical protein
LAVGGRTGWPALPMGSRGTAVSSQPFELPATAYPYPALSRASAACGSATAAACRPLCMSWTQQTMGRSRQQARWVLTGRPVQSWCRECPQHVCRGSRMPPSLLQRRAASPPPPPLGAALAAGTAVAGRHPAAGAGQQERPPGGADHGAAHIAHGPGGGVQRVLGPGRQRGVFMRANKACRRDSLRTWHAQTPPVRCVPLLPTATEQKVTGREVCVYSISCKCTTNIDITLQWLTAHAKKG